MRKLAIGVIAILALVCYGRNGFRGGALGPACLDTVYLRYRIPVVYLLFVADVGSPEARGAWGGGGTFGAWNAELRRTYTHPATRTRIEAPPVVIRGTTLRTAGKSFDLTRGNVLVIHLSSSGAATVTQLPERRGADEPAKTIVSLIKAALPHDPRVQAVPLL